MAALDVMSARKLLESNCDLPDAVVHTAERTGFHGRWEKISDTPYTICDIGHNEHGLKYNFAQLERMRASGDFTHLVIVYGSVADKDVDAMLHLLPEDATYVFTQASSKRALPAEEICRKYLDFCGKAGRCPGIISCASTVAEAMTLAYSYADAVEEQDSAFRTLVYVGGSTYVVSEAVACLMA